MVDGVCHSTHPVDHPDVKPMGAVTICRNGYVEDLERRLRDTEKLLAQYSAEREHNAMVALRYENAIAHALVHLRACRDADGRTMGDSDAARTLERSLTP